MKKSAFLLLTLSFAVIVQAQTAPGKRVRIGLALSGGGALGLAHVGVLKYFEEHHIPVDVIAGTSMGGLVAGFYATGLDANQLHQLTHSVSWDDMLRTTPKYEDLTIAEKQSWNRANADTTLRFRRNLALPLGLNPGQGLALLLSRYTAAYADVNTFDDLPIPFRCVATDLTSAEAYPLDHGSLPLAMRATMAIPGIFTPVRLGDHILVDGGAVDNIPVDVLKTMSPDVVIAVSLDIAPASPKTLTSLTSVLRQVVNVVVLQNERRSLQQADVVIHVPLQEFENTDYTEGDAIEAVGYKAAESMAAALKDSELNDADWQEYLRARQSKIRPQHERGRVVAVESPQPTIQRDASHELQRKLPGEVSRQHIEDALAGVTAAASIPSAYYGWQSGDNPGYQISLQERPSGGEVLIRPSLGLQVSGGEPTRASLHISTVTNPTNAYKSRLLGEGSIGYDPGIRTEYYKPFDGRAYFIAPGAFIQRTHIDSYNGSQIEGHVRDRFAGTLYGGLGTWRFVQWRLGITAGYDRVSQPVLANGINSDSTAFAKPETTLLIDTQDKGILPSRGTRANAAAGYSIRTNSYPYLNAAFSHFQPLEKKSSLFFIGRGATSFGRNLGYYDQFTGGGFADLSAFRFQEFHANTLATAGTGAYTPIPKISISGWKPLIATWYEVGRFDQGAKGWSTEQSASAGIFGPTPLGTAGLALSSDQNGKLRLRLVFGSF
ncbi:MAG TPA: patatin-like phospholipase family protein [Terriglobales bacterium]|nr:patatin-like phospholipase family protein [Terriglobales bacterium]